MLGVRARRCVGEWVFAGVQLIAQWWNAVETAKCPLVRGTLIV